MERQWEDQRKDPDDVFFHARDGLAEAKTTSRAMPAKRCQDRWIRRPGKPAFVILSVLGLNRQCRQLAPGFLRGDEIRVGVLPELEQLFVASRGRCPIDLGLGSRRSQ